MNKKHLFYTALIMGAIGTLAVALTLNFSRGKSTPALSPAVEAPLLAQGIPRTHDSKGGPVEGIKVHGHWTIDVRNPDGTLVTSREFYNAYVPSKVVAQILSRQTVPDHWEIALYDTVQGRGISFNEQNTGELKVTAPLSGSNAFALVLTGTATNDHDSSLVINQVSTFLSTCAGTTLPGQCLIRETTVTRITQKELAQPVNGVCPESACAVTVVPGQIVQLTVVISLS